MPRKSSFLMGFETGSDLYSRGYSQAMSLAQMKQQADEKKYQRGRDVVQDRMSQDLASQRKKRLEMEVTQFKAQQKERTRKLEQMKTSTVAMNSAWENLGILNLDYGDPYQLKIANDALKPYERHILDPSVLEMHKLKKNTIWTEEVKRQIENANTENNFIKLAWVEAKTKRDISDERERNELNKLTGSSFLKGDDWKPWARKVELWAAEAKDLGRIDVTAFSDFPGSFKGLRKYLEDKVDEGYQAAEIADAKAKMARDAKDMATYGTTMATGKAGIALDEIKRAMGGLNDQDRKTVIDMYGKLRLDPSIKKYQEASAQFESMSEVLGSGTAASDLAMVFMFMKSLDPTSVVREGEQEMARRATGVPDQIFNYANRIAKGETLTPPQRMEFLDVAERAVRGLHGKAWKVVDSYQAQTKAVGVPEHTFEPVRKMIGRPEFTFKSMDEFNKARPNIPPGSKAYIEERDGSLTRITIPLSRAPETPAPETPAPETPAEEKPPITGETRADVERKVMEQHNPGDTVKVIDPKTNRVMDFVVPGTRRLPDDEIQMGAETAVDLRYPSEPAEIASPQFKPAGAEIESVDFEPASIPIPPPQPDSSLIQSDYKEEIPPLPIPSPMGEEEEMGEGEKALEELLKQIGEKNKALMKVLGDEGLRRKAVAKIMGDPGVQPSQVMEELKTYPNNVQEVVKKLLGGEKPSEFEIELLKHYNIDPASGKITGPRPELPPPPTLK